MNPLDRTPAGDQYSLGCILYFCLTGQFPFPHANPVKKMLGHQCEEPTPVRELNPQVSTRLAGIVEMSHGQDAGRTLRDHRRCGARTSIVDAVQSTTQTFPTNTRAGAGRRRSAGAPERGSGWGVWPLVLTGLAAAIIGGGMAVLLTQRLCDHLFDPSGSLVFDLSHPTHLFSRPSAIASLMIYSRCPRW